MTIEILTSSLIVIMFIPCFDVNYSSFSIACEKQLKISKG